MGSSADSRWRRSRCAGRRDLGSGYFRGVVPSLAVDLLSVAIFFALGVAAALLGSIVPAVETARASLALALKAGDEERAFTRLRAPLPGLAAIALGAAATLLPPVAGLPLAGYCAIALLLVGTLMLLPRLASLALRLLPLPRAPAPALALAQLRGAPGQVTVSLAAIVASVSLMVSMAIMVASFRDSLDEWLERVLPADIYVRAAAGGETAFLAPDVQARITALPGVQRAEFMREQQLLARSVARARRAAGARHRPRERRAQPSAAGRAGRCRRRRAASGLGQRGDRRSLHFSPGSVITLPLDGKARSLHRCRRLARLRAAARRHRNGTRALCRADR